MKPTSQVLTLALFSLCASLFGCKSSSSSSSGAGTGDSAPDGVGSTVTGVERLWRDAGFGLVAHDEVLDGVFIATDYAYDDRGPNTDMAAGGDSTYPTGGAPYFKNAADLVEVRLMPIFAEQKLLIGVRLNTLVDSAVPVAAVGIADGTAAALAKAWPFSPGVSATGVRYVVTLTGDSATLTDLASGQSTSFPATVFNDQTESSRNLENTLSTIIPLDALGVQESDAIGDWVLHAVAGLWENDQWAEAPFDLAFLQDTFVNWQQDKQSDMLAGGDISSASATLKPADFPDRKVVLTAGRHSRIYPSAVSAVVGEGIAVWNQRIEGIEIPTLNHYRGLYLPYTLWVPEEINTSNDLPLFIYLHGASQNHLTHLQPWVDGVIDAPAFVIAPIGAGELSFYKEEGEIDVLASMEDVIQHYPIDRDRVFLSGLSMGGQGTFSVGTHRPDLFAAAVPLIGTGQSTFNEDVPGNTETLPSNRWMNSTGRQMLESALNLPFRMANGAIDPIVNISWPTQDVARMSELGNDHQFLIFYGRHHETIPEYINAVYHQVIDGCASAAIDSGCVASRDPGGIKRDVNPARVRYKVVPYHFEERIGLRYDGAYWVSGMVVRSTPNDVSFGLVDASSFALAAKSTEKLETLAFSPTLVFSPTGDNYAFQGVRRAASPGAKQSRLTAELTNLSHITFDLTRAGIAPVVTMSTLTIESDGDTLVRLTGLAPSVQLSSAGSALDAAENGEVTIPVSVGSTEIVLRP